MELNKTAAAVETILFAMGDSVEISALAQALEVSEDEVTRIGVRVIFDSYPRHLTVCGFEEDHRYGIVQFWPVTHTLTPSLQAGLLFS